MKFPYESQLLRIYVGDGDRHDGHLLYEAIVRKAHDMGMAGATVLHGTMGFGAHSRLHTAKLLRLSEGLPVLVEIVDRPEKIEAFLPELDAMVEEGLVTLEKVTVVTYRHGEIGARDRT